MTERVTAERNRAMLGVLEDLLHDSARSDSAPRALAKFGT